MGRTLRTAIELKIDVLNALRHDPLKISYIMYATRINCTILKPILAKFIEMKLIELVPPRSPYERKLQHNLIEKTSRQVLYRLTPQGIKTLKTWNELETQVLCQIGEVSVPSLQRNRDE
jgi:predicted transcriptional regulator